MTEAHITQHGMDRLSERSGKPKRAIQKLANDALSKGKKHSEFSGSFKRYLDGVFLDHRNATNMRVYAAQLFLFRDDVLITAWQIPPKYRGVKAKRQETSNG